MSAIGNFKERLARIRVGSFRYHMTKGIWKDYRIKNSRACTFYWWYLPSSAVAWFVLGLLFVIYLIGFYLLFVPLTWLLGFTIQHPNALDPDVVRYHGGYGYNPIFKRREPIAYQHLVALIALLVVVLWASLRGGVPWAAILTWSAVVAVGVAVIAGIGFLVTQRAVRDAWHRICPELEVVEEVGS